MRADIGAPLVILLLALAGIGLAIYVIMMMTPPPPPPSLTGNPEIRIMGNNTEITMTIKNPATKNVKISKIAVESDNGEISLFPPGNSTVVFNKVTKSGEQSWDGILKDGETATVVIKIKNFTSFGDKDRYKITIYTDNGIVHGTAVFTG